MESLISDCFPPILSYLSLADLLNLRILSRQLKQEVEDYLPNIRSLPLYLTTPRTPKEIAKYRELFRKRDHPNELCPEHCKCHISSNLIDELCIRQFSFGTSGPETPEDGTILQHQNHFRREDFLILNSSSALLKFLPFIKKLCPKIDKLALVIDHCEHYLPEVSKVLEALPAIKVLLMESTLQDACRYDNLEGTERLLFNVRCNPKNHVILEPEVFHSIHKLSKLEELFLFPKRQTQLILNGLDNSLEEKFIEKMLGRLRVLHFNNNDTIIWDMNLRDQPGRIFYPPVEKIHEGPLEELACGQNWWLTDQISDKLELPRLKKLISIQTLLLSMLCNNLKVFPRSQMKVLDISHETHYFDCEISAKNLNSFTGLESFLCGCLWSDDDFEYQEPEKKKRKTETEVDNEIVDDKLKNWTIKHIQVMEGPQSAEDQKRKVRRWSKYFVAMETCAFLEPEYSVYRVADLRN